MTRGRATALAVLAAVVAGGVLAGAWWTASPTTRERLLERVLREEGSLAPVPNDLELQEDINAVIVRVAVAAPGTPISPGIYGVAGADPDTLRTLGATLNRWGGNPSSRFNWVNGHAWNAGRDWKFSNLNYSNSTASQSDQFVAEAEATRVGALMTVPAIGWVARDDSQEHRSTGVPARGGAPVAPGSDAIAGYDPGVNRARTSVESLPRKPGPLVLDPDPNSSVVYQDEWVHHLVTRFGDAAVPYFAIDNEPDLWPFTHTDVHPAEPGYDDMLKTFLDYARAVKAQDPRAKVLGPTVSGWTGYMYSALDRGNDNFGTHADRAAHGNAPFLEWWLAQVGKADQKSGVRSLDDLDVHYYPQAPEVTSKSDDADSQALRIRSTRSLYDPAYVDESWIGEPVNLIPRLKAWIGANYPGTGLAISEYNWGGALDPSGAVAEAIVLGVFGREGVDVANYWTYPSPDSFPGAAFMLYRNYDGHAAHFGDLSLPAAANHRLVSTFAARDSRTGDLDVMLINGAQVSASVRLDLSRTVTGPVQAYSVRDEPKVVARTIPALDAPVVLAPLSATLLHLRADQLK